MQLKRIIAVLVLFLAGSGLMGCHDESLSVANEVKVENQTFDVITQMLLESAPLEADSLMMAVSLPSQEQYEIQLIVEEYENGKLMNSEPVVTSITDEITEDSLIYLIIHAGINETGSRFAIAETHSDTGFVISSALLPPIFNTSEDGRAQATVETDTKDVSDEMLLAVFVQFSSDTVSVYNLEEYEDRSLLLEYERAVLVKTAIKEGSSTY